VEKGLTALKARAAARKARDLVIRKSALESLTLPGKLADWETRRVAPPSRVATGSSRRFYLFGARF